MPDQSLLNPDLVQLNIEVNTKEEILKNLATLLIDKGCVKESYLEAILEREKVFPTGLPTEGVGVAIPHADTKYVNMPAIAIAILKKPVEFNVMGNPDEKVEVKIVFMLAIKEPHMQVNLLKNLVSIFQDKKLLIRLTNSLNKNSIISLLSDIINLDAQKGDSLYESAN